MERVVCKKRMKILILFTAKVNRRGTDLFETAGQLENVRGTFRFISIGKK